MAQAAHARAAAKSRPAQSARPFPLPSAAPQALNLDPAALERMCAIIEGHVARKLHPGGQVAVIRHGKLALHRTFGDACIEPKRVAADDRTVWRIYSNTKMLTTTCIWILVEEGALTFHDKVADHIPEFARNGKGDITIHQLLSHRAGFPLAGTDFSPAIYTDHELMRRMVCDFSLEWTPGSRVRYHHQSAHWIAAVLIEALTKTDYRDVIRRRVIEPLGLEDELFVGLPAEANERAADVHDAAPDGTSHIRHPKENDPAFRAAGIPASGGMATARALAAYYQMLAQGGALNGARIVSPRMVQYVTRNFTGEELDHAYMLPMHRGLGPQSRGLSPEIIGLGTIAGPRTFGHGGVGTSYAWGDPDTGVSFAFVSNSRLPSAQNQRRLELLSTCVHAAILDA
ncbi:MAG: beta-lactamase family protein [Variibacter sp.]|nr:beta-lactamase family protein [Variibacter sp.]